MKSIVGVSSAARLGSLGVVLVVVGVLPLVVTSDYRLGIFTLGLVNVIIVLGFNLIWGLAGQMALAQAGFVAAAAYTVAILTIRFHAPFWAALCGGVAVAAVLAAVLGIATLRLTTFYLGLATLCFVVIVQEILLNWNILGDSANGAIGIPTASIFGMPMDSARRQYYLIAIVGVLAAIVSVRLARSQFGLECRALRSDERAAKTMGINTFRVKMIAFVISSVFAGVGGALYAQLYNTVGPDTFSFSYMITLIAMLIIGGAGTTGGVIVGAVFITWLPELVRAFGKWEEAIYGFGIVVLILFAPDGVWGLGARYLRRAKRMYSRRAAGRPRESTVVAQVGELVEEGRRD